GQGVVGARAQRVVLVGVSASRKQREEQQSEHDKGESDDARTEKGKPQAKWQLLVQGIAGAAHRVQQARFAVQLQLLTQVADVDGDDVVAVGLALPHRVDQLLAGQDLAGMAQEVPQQVELGGGQVD